DAMAHGIAARANVVATREKEVIHPANAGQGIAKARRDAASEDGRHHHVGVVGHALLALHHVSGTSGQGLGERAWIAHVSVPNTASSFSFSVATVKGFTR